MPESLLSPSDLDALKARLALDFPWDGLPSLQIISEADRLSVVAINRGHLIQQEHDQLFQVAVGSFLEIIENELPYLGYKVKEERLLLYSPHNEAFKVADLLIEKQPTQTPPITRIASPGPGKGCLHSISCGRPSSCPSARTSSLKSSRTGSTKPSFIFSGKPPTL